MLTLPQMENYVALLDTIDQYKRLLSRDGLHAVTYDKPSGGCAFAPDTVGETVVKQERRRAQLSQLEALAAIQRPEVEKTIKAAATLQTRGTVKIELALRARYLSGWSWPEISDMLHIQNPAQITAAAVKRLEMEGDR